jgi:NifU-like protein involved in Fe-S cluster formation
LEGTATSSKITEKEMQLLKAARYSRKVVELYSKKVNVGAITNPDVAFAYTGPCGDTIKFYLKIRRDYIIEEARFQYLGCPASAACGSILTQMITGKTIQEAKKVTDDDVLTKLDGLPDEDCHCAELVVMTLNETIIHYQKKD